MDARVTVHYRSPAIRKKVAVLLAQEQLVPIKKWKAKVGE
jgi:hypothetical protein